MDALHVGLEVKRKDDGMFEVTVDGGHLTVIHYRMGLLYDMAELIEHLETKIDLATKTRID